MYLLLSHLIIYLLLLTMVTGEILRPRFYSETCPEAESIVRNEMKKALIREARSVASVMRLQFHDCFVNVNTTNLSLSSWFFYLISYLFSLQGMWRVRVARRHTEHARRETITLQHQFTEIFRSRGRHQRSSGENLSIYCFLCRHRHHGFSWRRCSCKKTQKNISNFSGLVNVSVYSNFGFLWGKPDRRTGLGSEAREERQFNSESERLRRYNAEPESKRNVLDRSLRKIRSFC